MTADETRDSIHNKVVGYLFNPKNSQGWVKGRWFIIALGFEPNNQQHHQILEEQIKFNKKQARFSKTTEWGIRYIQEVSITGPNGKTIYAVRTIWQQDKNTGIVRLITIMPPKK